MPVVNEKSQATTEEEEVSTRLCSDEMQAFFKFRLKSVKRHGGCERLHGRADRSEKDRGVQVLFLPFPGTNRLSKRNGDRESGARKHPSSPPCVFQIHNLMRCRSVVGSFASTSRRTSSGW